MALGDITVCWTRNDLFIPRVRRPGARRYEVLCETRSRKKAYRLLAEAMETGQWKRGDVLATTREPSYYDPIVIVEMVA